jgi:hypothetical protein
MRDNEALIQLHNGPNEVKALKTMNLKETKGINTPKSDNACGNRDISFQKHSFKLKA